MKCEDALALAKGFVRQKVAELSQGATEISKVIEELSQGKEEMSQIAEKLTQTVAEITQALEQLTPEDIGAFPVTQNITEAGTDVNNYTKNGIYYFSSGYTPENAPAGLVNGWLLVLAPYSGTVKQVWMRYGTANKNDYETYVRSYYSGGTWSNWSQYATVKNSLPASSDQFATFAAFWEKVNELGSKDAAHMCVLRFKDTGSWTPKRGWWIALVGFQNEAGGQYTVDGRIMLMSEARIYYGVTEGGSSTAPDMTVTWTDVLHPYQFSEEELPIGADLDEYTQVGIYKCLWDAHAQSYAHCPTPFSFVLQVFNHPGFLQELTTYLPLSPQKYIRNYYNDGWGPWYKIYTESDKPTPENIGALPATGGELTGQLVPGGGVAHVGKSAWIAYPEDGAYNSREISITGYLAITLPQTWTDTMIKFSVSIFNYDSSNQENDSVEYTVYGYTYHDMTKWYNCGAICIGKAGTSKSNLPVRFGHNGSKCVVLIGESTTVWSYPQVQVHNILPGYINMDYEKWCKGWNVQIANINPTITFMVSNTHVAYGYMAKMEALEAKIKAMEM